jgi:hypothetical protein
VATSKDEKQPPRGDRGECADCGAVHTGGQRYCLRCGARLGALPAAIAGQLPEMLERKRGGGEAPVEAAPEKEPVEVAPEQQPASPYSLPPPRVAAAAVLVMLGLGVLLGSVTSHLAQSAGLTSILLEAEPAPPVAAPEEEEAEFTEEESAPAEEAEAIPSSVPELPPPPVEEPEPALPPEPEPPPEPPAEETLPDVKHVFVVVLGENGFEETFGKTSPAPYLAQTLPEQGELLTNYFAVTAGGLANQIALLSGQGPTPETAAGCPTYTDVVPATLSPAGQVEGNGCVYPTATPSLPAQLSKVKLKWKAYVEGAENPAVIGPTVACGQSPRDPLAYLHAVVDDPKCAQTNVALSQLAPDLQKATTTPTLSYIVPNACHDGGLEPCEEGKLAGPLAAEEFLKALVPVLTASPAYKEGGLIAITSSQAPQTGATPDTSGCCVSPAYPNVPAPPAGEAVTGPVKPSGGGGRVGLLLLSPFVKAGTVNETTYANHYSLLLSIEELFELERIGYAAEPALVGFDSSVYNAAEEEKSTLAKRAQSKRISSAVSRPNPIAATDSVRSAHGAGSAKRPSASALATAAR